MGFQPDNALKTNPLNFTISYFILTNFEGYQEIFFDEEIPNWLQLKKNLESIL